MAALLNGADCEQSTAIYVSDPNPVWQAIKQASKQPGTAAQCTWQNLREPKTKREQLGKINLRKSQPL